MSSFLVIDDHPLVRTGMALTLQGMSERIGRSVEVHQAPDITTGLRIVREQPELVLIVMDLNLPVIDGLAGLALVRQLKVALPVLMMSAQAIESDVELAIARGARGFFPKSYDSQDILKVIECVLEGRIYKPSVHDQADTQPMGMMHLPRPLAAHSLPNKATAATLTDRQMQVMALLAQGKSNKEICRELDLAAGTVKMHISSVFSALQVSNRTQALIAASRLGLTI
jgi:DNA-binding NarL/FixJ family response regulator